MQEKLLPWGKKIYEQTKPQCLEYREMLWEEKARGFFPFFFFSDTYVVITKLPKFLCQTYKTFSMTGKCFYGPIFLLELSILSVVTPSIF